MSRRNTGNVLRAVPDPGFPVAVRRILRRLHSRNVTGLTPPSSGTDVLRTVKVCTENERSRYNLNTRFHVPWTLASHTLIHKIERSRYNLNTQFHVPWTLAPYTTSGIAFLHKVDVCTKNERSRYKHNMKLDEPWMLINTKQYTWKNISWSFSNNQKPARTTHLAFLATSWLFNAMPVYVTDLTTTLVFLW
ncbi:hypothetical protein J6590_075315 [Homalodisca vitripennis]|nr:hypothetical protein J6590_075315 [Homalodisca vitripennis]